MSGSHNSPGLLSAMSGTVSEEVKQHAHATPAVKASNRGYVGAFLLSGSGFLFVADDFASYPEDLKIAVAVAAVLGLVLLWTALRTHNQREPLAAFFAIAEAVGLFLAVHSWAPQLLRFPMSRILRGARLRQSGAPVPGSARPRRRAQAGRQRYQRRRMEMVVTQMASDQHNLCQ